jgi:hypothetical protein
MATTSKYLHFLNSDGITAKDKASRDAEHSGRSMRRLAVARMGCVDGDVIFGCGLLCAMEGEEMESGAGAPVTIVYGASTRRCFRR